MRARTGARTGHAGTLDPFATGLLVLLSGRATSVQDRFMRLDKRYVTDVDLTRDDDDRRSRGRASSTATSRSSGASLEGALDGLRGAVELPIPAASAVKIDGQARVSAAPATASRSRCRGA